jgi:tetratricopeptide (TPR) repeat protein
MGRFADAQEAARNVLDLVALDDSQRGAVQRYQGIARFLGAVEGRVQDVLAGKQELPDLATRRLLAEWLNRYQRNPVAAAQQYEILLAKKAPLSAAEREQAAFVASRVGFGIGEVQLEKSEMRAWRTRALAWLQSIQPRGGKGPSPLNTFQTARRWQRDLAAIRADAVLATLPGDERDAWRTFWSDIDTLVDGDPLTMVEKAHAHVVRQEWAQAAAFYEKIVKSTLASHGQIWFEYAATQLLAGDREGYRRSCKHMLEAKNTSTMRSYHAARACTLAADSLDMNEPIRASAKELQQSKEQFWSLTEQGALFVRTKACKRSLPLFARSIKAEPRPGVAVLNWLWLALAHHDLGNDVEARRNFKKADDWLLRIGNHFPERAESLRLDLHNWLEAHILRREAADLLKQPPAE